MIPEAPRINTIPIGHTPTPIPTSHSPVPLSTTCRAYSYPQHRIDSVLTSKEYNYTTCGEGLTWRKLTSTCPVITIRSSVCVCSPRAYTQLPELYIKIVTNEVILYMVRGIISTCGHTKGPTYSRSSSSMTFIHLYLSDRSRSACDNCNDPAAVASEESILAAMGTQVQVVSHLHPMHSQLNRGGGGPVGGRPHLLFSLHSSHELQSGFQRHPVT